MDPSTVHASRPQEFPGSITGAHGKPAIEAIETMSGKKVPGQTWRKIAPGKGGRAEDRIPLLLDQYRHMLRFLTEKGCLLNSVRPEVWGSASAAAPVSEARPKEGSRVGNGLASACFARFFFGSGAEPVGVALDGSRGRGRAILGRYTRRTDVAFDSRGYSARRVALSRHDRGGPLPRTAGQRGDAACS